MVIEVEAGDHFRRQRPIEGLAVVALPVEEANLTSTRVRVTAYDKDGDPVAAMDVLGA